MATVAILLVTGLALFGFINAGFAWLGLYVAAPLGAITVIALTAIGLALRNRNRIKRLARLVARGDASDRARVERLVEQLRRSGTAGDIAGAPEVAEVFRYRNPLRTPCLELLAVCPYDETIDEALSRDVEAIGEGGVAPLMKWLRKRPDRARTVGPALLRRAPAEALPTLLGYLMHAAPPEPDTEWLEALRPFRDSLQAAKAKASTLSHNKYDRYIAAVGDGE